MSPVTESCLLVNSHRRHQPCQAIQPRPILIINPRNNNISFLATPDATGTGNAIENGRGRGNAIGSLLRTLPYPTQATLLPRGRYRPFTSMLMGF